MTILKTIIASVFSFVFLLLLAKLTGSRQVSQLSMFDYINGITIGSIAAELSLSELHDMMSPAVAMAVFSLGAIGVNFISQKSLGARRFLSGKTVVLFGNGKLYRDNIKHSRINMSEFIEAMHVEGYFSLSDISEAYLEANGHITFLASELHRPLTPHDMGITPEKASSGLYLVLDGKIIKENLKAAGRDERWLMKTLSAQGFADLSGVFAAEFAKDGTLAVYGTDEMPRNNDVIK